MTHVIMALDLPCQNMLSLLRDGIHLLLLASPDNSIMPADEKPKPALLIAGLTTSARVPALAAAARRHRLVWIAWNLDDDPALGLAAYKAGARAVLPATVPGSVLLGLIHATAERLPRHGRDGVAAAAERWYHRGERIPLPAGSVLEICDGIVALTAVHEDGVEVLLGLCGPGELVVDAGGSAPVQPLAHTIASITTHSWKAALGQADLAERLYRQLRDTQAWAAVQGHSRLDQRLIGTLSLLAQKFGVRRSRGIVIDVRVTHAQLASAIGATRVTVTRLLSSMRKQGIVTSVGSGDAERLCLVRWSPALAGPGEQGHANGSGPTVLAGRT